MFAKLAAVLLALPLALVFAVAMSALFAWPVQWLLNYLIPGTSFVVTFKQAWALSLLCSLLFKSSK